MNQRQLGYFLEVYKLKSISQAAEALFLSPQALSKTISALELELAVPLFIHKSNRIIPTSAAANLATHAKNIIAEYDIIENRLFKDKNIQKILSLSCSYDVPQMLNADFFYSFFTEHSEIRVQLREYPDSYIMHQLENNDVELAIIPGPIDSQKFFMEPLFTDSFCLVVNKNHPLANRESISPTDLHHENIVVKDLSSAISETQFSSFLEDGVLPQFVLETTDSHLIHQMAEKNYAIGMTLTYLAEKIKSENIVIIPFTYKWIKKTLYLTHKKDLILSNEAALFREKLLLCCFDHFI